jgi:pilus assembly protein FimV
MIKLPKHQNCATACADSASLRDIWNIMMPIKNTTDNSLYIHAVIACLLLLTPLYSYALGVQDIEVLSGLNQPLNARARLNLDKGQKIYEIKAKLASPKDFKQSGLEIPHFLTRLRFKPKVDKDGTAYIHITSREVVREPYLIFLVEVNWQGGNFIKEFTALLDPVVINQAPSKPNRLPVVKKGTEQKPQPPKEQLYGPVQDAETLWEIAEKNRPSQSVSVNEMINSIYLANPDAFIRGDINLLKRGVTLRIPQIKPVTALVDEAESKPISEPKQEQKISATNIIKNTTSSEQKPETSTKPSITSIPSQTVNNPEITKPETTLAEDSGTKSENSSATQAAADNSGKLEVKAVPESQIDEIKQSEGKKVYPANEIEQLRGAIADKTGDIAALKAINTDLQQLQSALKQKIKVIREELEDTNKTIDNMSKEIEASRNAISKKIASNKKITPSPKESLNKDKTTIAAATPAASLTPELESKKKGVNIATDKIALEQVEKLEAEIKELKAQQETAQTQKYVIILLLLALLGAAAFVILSSRGQLPKLDRIANFFKLSPRHDKQTSEFLELIDTQVIPEHLEQSEMPFEAKSSSERQEGYYSELLTKLASQDGGLSALEPTSNSDKNLDFQDTEPTATEDSDEHDIERTLTSVDVYVAYRRFSEAEFALEKAIEEIADNKKLKAKLLEIYAMKNDVKALTQHLDTYHKQLSIQAPILWQKVLEKCARLIPNNSTIQKYLDEAPTSSDTHSEVDTGNTSDTTQTNNQNELDDINLSDLRLTDDEESEEIDMDLFFHEQKSDDNN